MGPPETVVGKSRLVLDKGGWVWEPLGVVPGPHLLPFPF